MSRLRIRRATADDLRAIQALERDSPTAAHWPQAQYDALARPSAAARIVLLLEEESTLLAFLIARSQAEEWELESLVVSAPARRRGLGMRMLGELLSLARTQGAQAVLLEVRESNAPARALYEKCGFAEMNRRRHYYREPVEDAVTYRLTLHPQRAEGPTASGL